MISKKDSKAISSLFKNHNKGSISESGDYTSRFYYYGREYCYMSLVTPHNHSDQASYFDKIWKVVFYFADKDFVFAFRNNGSLYFITPEIGKEYSFDSTKLHAFIHKDMIPFFYKRNFWKTIPSDNKIRCIFSLY